MSKLIKLLNANLLALEKKLGVSEVKHDEKVRVECAIRFLRLALNDLGGA